MNLNTLARLKQLIDNDGNYIVNILSNYYEKVPTLLGKEIRIVSESGINFVVEHPNGTKVISSFKENK